LNGLTESVIFIVLCKNTKFSHSTIQRFNNSTIQQFNENTSAKFFILSYFVNKRIILSLQSVYYPSVKVRFSQAKYAEIVPISLIQVQ